MPTRGLFSRVLCVCIYIYTCEHRIVDADNRRPMADEARVAKKQMVYKTNMEDQEGRSDANNSENKDTCTFLFKKRTIRNKASRKREKIDENGKLIQNNIEFNYMIKLKFIHLDRLCCLCVFWQFVDQYIIIIM